MDKSLIELSEKFRTGQVNRREFIQRVVVLAGGAAAAAPLLRQLGFDSGLIREALDNGSPMSITGRAAETAREMRVRSPKAFEWEVYNEAPHGFFREGTPPDDHVAEIRPALIARDLMFDFLDRY
jgi:hypothetical protein